MVIKNLSHIISLSNNKILITLKHWNSKINTNEKISLTILNQSKIKQ